MSTTMAFELELFKCDVIIWLEIWLLRRNNNDRLEKIRNRDQDYYLRFDGINPITGEPAFFQFDEPHPNRKNILSWNHLTGCFFYSEDAGLTWERTEDDVIGWEKVHVVI